MRSVTSIITPPASVDLVTLDQVKLVMNITDTSEDDLLSLWISQASKIASSYCNVVLASQTVSQIFRQSLGRGDYFTPRFCFGLNGSSEEALLFSSAPVSSIVSVTVDGSLLDTTLYETDTDKLYRLTSAGYPTPWNFNRAIVVIYITGFTLGADVPEDIQAAVLALIREYRGSASRDDPYLKRRRTEGVSEIEYWVPSASTSSLSIEVSGILDQYRLRWGWMR